MRSPFTGLRFAGMELDNFRAGTMIKFAIVAISLIPLIYGGLFLLAFLDPYGNLVNVPAAVVNEDRGSEIDGEHRNVGQELCDELVENNKEAEPGQPTGYDWHFVDRSTADKGLDDATYYMEVIIPSDFTANIASADKSAPQPAELDVFFNPSTNLIAQTVGSSMVTKIKSELTGKIDEEYFDQIFVKISDASDQLQDAVDGASELEDGLEDAHSGSGTLADGIKDARSGSNTITLGLGTLQSGAKKLDKGADQLADGTGQLADGTGKLKKSTKDMPSQTKQLADGASSLADGASQLSDGTGKLKEQTASMPAQTKQLADGAQQVASGASSLASGASALKDGVDQLDAQVPQLSSGAQQVAAGVTEVKDKLSGLAGSLPTAVNTLGSVEAGLQALESKDTLTDADKQTIAQLKAAVTGVKSGLSTAAGGLDTSKLETLESGAKQVSGGLQLLESKTGDLKDGASRLKSGAAQVSSGASQVADGNRKLADSAPALVAGIEALDSGASQVSGGASKVESATSTLASGAKTLVNGIKSLDTGAKKVDSGAEKLADGTGSLVSGADKLHDGSATLTDGLGDAVDGADELHDGLKSAVNGTGELKDGLEDGQQTMAENVENKDEKVTMMAEPVVANGEHGTGENITQVANYGTGFAPYFIALGMWVGALMVSFLIRSLNSRILMSSASSMSAVLASYIPMAVVCIVQAMLLLLFIQFGLGMVVKYPVAYYLFGMLTALAFAAIIQFFRAALGTVGMVVIVVLLMLQLCTAAGTFPIEAELPVFQVLNPFLPMTYVVGGFRMAMAGLSLSYFWPDVAVLALFGAMFLVFTLLLARQKRRVSMTTLYPPIHLAS